MANVHVKYETVDAGRRKLPILEGERAGGLARSQPRQIYVSKIPCYMGSECIEGFLQWVADVEQFFDTIAVPEEKMVKIVALRLKGYVAFWWDQMQKSRRQQGKDPIKSWHRMKRLIVRYLFPLEYNIYLLRSSQTIVKDESMMETELLVNLVDQEKKEDIEEEVVLVVDPNVVKEEIPRRDELQVETQGVDYCESVNLVKLTTTKIMGEDFSVNYSKLVYGVGSMVIPVAYQECCTPTLDQVLFKENSRSSSLQVKGSDVGQHRGRLKWKTENKNKQLKVGKTPRKKGNLCLIFKNGVRKGRKSYQWDFRVD